MNTLEKYFNENQGSLIHKWQHYFDVYDRHFSRYRETEVHVVEFGVSHGGSLQMWQHYFGDRAHVYGIDINPECKKFESENIHIFIGDQEDKEFLNSLVKAIPVIDILIDDGGHTMRQQISTFEVLFPHVDKRGIYLVEDLQTSYSRSFGGGYKRAGTFIEYSKNFIDQINAWHSENEKQLSVSSFTKTAQSLHYYDGVLVIEKRPVERPYHKQTGSPSIGKYNAPKESLFRRAKNAIFSK